MSVGSSYTDQLSVPREISLSLIPCDRTDNNNNTTMYNKAGCLVSNGIWDSL